MLTHALNTSFASLVQDFYTGSEDKFFWKFDKKCDNDISVEYPNLLVKRCSFESTDERRSVKWCTPFSISQADGVITKVNFVISFDKSISGDNCESEYLFKSINLKNGVKIDGDGSLVLYSEDGITTYSTVSGSGEPLTITPKDNIGWYDLIFEFNITDELCNIEGFDYCIEVDGEVNSYKKNNCHKSSCHKSSCTKLKINYSSYITLEKV
jgi:hypothetical protein